MRFRLKFAPVFVLFVGFIAGISYADDLIFCDSYERCPGGSVWSCASPGGSGSCVPGPVSVDYTAGGYFTQPGNIFNPGLPPENNVGYLDLPAGVNHGELAQLHQDCVDRINQYRSGDLKFSNGSNDPGVPKPMLTELEGNNVCQSQSTLGDLFVNNRGSACEGAFTNFGSCGGGTVNTCCVRSGATYADIQATLYRCLQQMWDEGVSQPDDAPFTPDIGHWHNMRNPKYKFASCGFAFDTDGRVLMNQYFSASTPPGVPLTCSCEGKSIGDSDGCGRTCVSAN